MLFIFGPVVLFISSFFDVVQYFLSRD